MSIAQDTEIVEKQILIKTARALAVFILETFPQICEQDATVIFSELRQHGRSTPIHIFCEREIV